MRVVIAMVVWAALPLGPGAPPDRVLKARSQGGDPTATLAAARQALGGEARIAGVRTLVATGQTKQVRGDNLVPIEFEINIEFPDKYVRHDEIPAQETGITSRGFNGDNLIQLPPPPPPTPPGRQAAAPPSGPPVPPPGAVVMPLKQDFARLTLGMFATSFPAHPMTFTYAGTAEAPEGRADVVDVTGPAGFAARLFIDSQTHLPLMLSWQTPPPVVTMMPGQAPPANLPAGAVVVRAPGPPPGPASTPEEREAFQQAMTAARAAAMKTAQSIEHRLYYADYRSVNGLKLPFRIRRATGVTTNEEMTFDRYRVNAAIDPRKFEVRK